MGDAADSGAKASTPKVSKGQKNPVSSRVSRGSLFKRLLLLLVDERLSLLVLVLSNLGGRVEVGDKDRIVQRSLNEYPYIEVPACVTVCMLDTTYLVVNNGLIPDG